MNALVASALVPSALTPRYLRDADPQRLLGPQTLAVFGFGPRVPQKLDDPRYLHVGLAPLDDGAWYEVWETNARVTPWREGGLRGARTPALGFGVLECDEGAQGIAAVSESAYRQLLAHLAGSPHPQLLRIWNYLDAITQGEGDAERYRQFCVGRAAGFALAPERLPAATAIGRRDGQRVLQMYWLSAASTGVPLENPRQVAAWRYPRQYGPRPPSFARAMLPPADVPLPLMLSGTAAVVGHASRHAGDLAAQLDETLRNFAALIEVARGHEPPLPPTFGAGSLLKVYLNNAARGAELESLLAARLAADVPRLVLQADICRADLALEIDGFHGG